jgi:pilus assembly protein CpaE
VSNDLQTRGVKASRRKLQVLLLASAANRPNVHDAVAGMTDLVIDVRDEDPGNVSPSAAAGVDVVMFEFDGRSPLQFSSTNGSAEPPVRVALLHERSPQAIRTALRAGADEVLFLPLNHEDLARVLLKISETRKETEPALAAKVVSIVSLTGGAGVTTVAANCGIALARTVGKKVALVDLDFQSGDFAVLLNLEPERTILDLNDTGLRLNSVQIESVLTHHSSGVYLLAAPKRIEESEQVTAARVGMIIGVMLQMVDVLIIDTGRHISDISVAAWEQSEQLLYIIDQSIGAVRGAWRFLDLFSRLDLTRIEPQFVLNRFMPRHPITEKQIVSTLSKALFARIPRDDSAVELSVGRGEDLWKAAPRSALTRAFEALAHQVSIPVHQPRKGGFLSRIFVRNGVHPGVKS